MAVSQGWAKIVKFFFNEEQSITEVKLKGLDHSISSSDWLGIQNSGFWVGIFFTFPSYQNNFWSFLMFFQSSAYIKLCKLYFWDKMMKCLVQLVFNPSALPKTKKPEFLIPEQSLGSVQTLPKFMVSANWNAYFHMYRKIFSFP